MKDKLSRKEFFEHSLQETKKVLFEFLFPIVEDKINEVFPDIVRPPGAKVEEEFLERCNRCGKCMGACRFRAIRAFPGAGSFVVGTPYLEFSFSQCRFCEDFPCILACPTGALSYPSEGNKIGALGLARIDSSKCLRSSNEDCVRCHEACETQAIELFEGSPPKVVPDKCTGCGGCQVACPVLEKSAIIIFPR